MCYGKEEGSEFQCWWTQEEGVMLTIQRIVLHVVRG